MRKVEMQMCEAIANCREWKWGNTSVKPTMPNCMSVYLGGDDHLADVTESGKILINFNTNGRWRNWRIAGSRINALIAYFIDGLN